MNIIDWIYHDGRTDQTHLPSFSLINLYFGQVYQQWFQLKPSEKSQQRKQVLSRC